jgi:hypothetical protein
MKTLFIFLALFIGTFIGTSQEVTELKEARIGFSPTASELTQDGNQFSFAVKELYRGEFQKDPIAFLNQNIDMEQFVELVRDQNYDRYEVNLKSTKGSLEAHFDRDGKLGATYERFEDILLPRNLMAQIYDDYKGWEMVKNVHITRGLNGQVQSEFYKIKLKNGKDSKRIKIPVDHSALGEVASN